MFEIQIAPIKKIYLIAEEADLSDVALLLVSSYEINKERVSNCNKLLALNFQDIIDENDINSFSDDIAKKIKDFVVSLPKSLDTLIVCCDSGESRSSAVVAAIMRYRLQDDSIIWKNPHYHPNPLVYSKLCEAFDITISKKEINDLIQINEDYLRLAVQKDSSTETR